MAIQDLGDGNPSGTRMGTASTDLIGFLGATPATQRTGSSMDAFLALVEEMRATMVALGLHAGS